MAKTASVTDVANWHTKLLLVVVGVVLSQSFAAGPPVEEYGVKGAFLLNFAKFVEWPPQAFQGPGDPISICILGASPFGPGLDAAAKALAVNSRPVTLRQIPDLQEAARCHILFLSFSQRKRVSAALAAVQGGSVLTVGETEDFIAAGGVIEFRVEQNKVRMDISVEAAKKVGLHVSAKLLSLAQSDNR